MLILSNPVTLRLGSDLPILYYLLIAGTIRTVWDFLSGLDFEDFRSMSCPAVEVCHFPTFHHPPRFLKRKGGVGSFLAVSGEKPKSLL
jgi:hypothetical protein